MRRVNNIMDKRRINELRSILRAVFIQIAVPLFDEISRYFIIFRLWMKISSLKISKVSRLSASWAGAAVLIIRTLRLTHVSVILITMQSYRSAVLSLIAPLKTILNCTKKDYFLKKSCI